MGQTLFERMHRLAANASQIKHEPMADKQSPAELAKSLRAFADGAGGALVTIHPSWLIVIADHLDRCGPSERPPADPLGIGGG